MAVSTIPKKIGDAIKWELGIEAEYARDKVTIISGQNLTIGTVLGKITASGKYTQYAPGASNGSQTIAAILLEDSDASDGDLTNRLVLDGPAVVVYDELVWPSDVVEATAIAGLKSIGIRAKVAPTRRAKY